MPSVTDSTSYSPFPKYISPKTYRDIKFCSITFVVICLIIFHYAWIMRQLITKPDLDTSLIGGYFGLFFVNCGILGYLLLFQVYNRIYAEDIAQEKREIAEALSKKKD